MLRNRHLLRGEFCGTNNYASPAAAHGEFRMSDNAGFRAHHKYMIAAIGLIAILGFLYNLGVFDVWSVEQARK